MVSIKAKIKNPIATTARKAIRKIQNITTHLSFQKPKIFQKIIYGQNESAKSGAGDQTLSFARKHQATDIPEISYTPRADSKARPYQERRYPDFSIATPQ